MGLGDVISGAVVTPLTSFEADADAASNQAKQPLEVYFKGDDTDDNVGINFSLLDSAGAKTNYGRVRCVIVDNTDTSEDARLDFLTQIAGTLTAVLTVANGRVGIGATVPNAAALLDLTSTTKGLLLPRMTTAQRDAITALNGLVLYNSTDNKVQAYVGGAWTDL